MARGHGARASVSAATWNPPCSALQPLGEPGLWAYEPRAWRRVFARCHKLGMMFAAFITAALIAEIIGESLR